MNGKGWVIVGIVVVLAGIAAAFVFLSPLKRATPIEPETDGSEVGNLEGQSLYASGEYGFTLQYPSSATLEETFSPDYQLAPTWRANAGPDEPGTPVLAVILYETESDTSYPRYYRAMVRVGVSDDMEALAQCEKADTGVGEEALGERVMNGYKWQSFGFQDAGMQKYVKGVSYRTLYDGKCFVVEAIAAGSSYREEESASDIPEEELLSAYVALDPIVQSFAFATP